MKELIITKDNAGGRLDKILTKYLDKAPKSFIYKMLRKKNIILNDKKAAGNEIVQAGDCIKLYLADDTIAKFQRHPEGAPAAKQDSDRLVSFNAEAFQQDHVIYEDTQIIVLNKPAGLLSQKSKPGDVSLNDLMVAYLQAAQREQAEETIPFTPGISNRLDRNTSGLVIAGKTLYASRELNRAIRDRSLKKKYLCIVKGIVTKGEMLDGYLVKDEKNNQVTVLSDPGEGKGENRIITVYEPIGNLGDATLLEVDLITGKSHQIRAHLASIGHPIIGDSKYGEKEINTEYRKKFGTKRQLLHAYKIIFLQMAGELAYLNGQHVEAQLPEDFSVILNQDI
ncbi:MAG: RluA family pseudouridine synthase [Lachnospiraceae bacterium]|nr:RluA family pseudouridine synthase [Lachnospiraceae bacterium]